MIVPTRTCEDREEDECKETNLHLNPSRLIATPYSRACAHLPSPDVSETRSSHRDGAAPNSVPAVLLAPSRYHHQLRIEVLRARISIGPLGLLVRIIVG